MNLLLWILALLTVAVTALLTYQSDVRRAVPKPWLTASLRAILVGLVWMLLLAPLLTVTKQEIQKPVIVFLQDESTSIKTALGGDSTGYREEVATLSRKLSDKYRVVTWGFGNEVRSDSLFRYGQTSTDISSALSRVQEFYGQQNLGAVVLATDGRYNSGSHPLYNDLALHAPLYAVALGDTSLPKDLKISASYAPRIVAKNNQFEIRADIIATRCQGYNGTVQLYEAGAIVGSNSLAITTSRFDKSAAFTIKAAAPGLHHYVISVAPMAGEDNVANNRRDVFVEVVEEKKNILIAAAVPHPDVAALKEALTGVDAYDITVRVGADIPASFSPYQVVILHGLPTQGRSLDLNGKAVWYILSTTTSAFTTPVAVLNINPSAQYDAYPRINTSFSLFNLPQRHALLNDKLPPLSAAGGTATPGPGTQVLFANRGNNAPLWLIQPGSPAQAFPH